MLPALQAFEPSPVQRTVQQSVVPNTVGSSAKQPTHSIWDDPNAFANASPQYNSHQQSPSNAWGYQQSPGAHNSTATYSNRPKTKSPKKPNAALTEQESGLQASGIFLIAVPVITTLLPLFGVQLRRLASLGNYAPIGGLFLGLIGSGIIVWARRKRSDAFVMGAIGAVCSTVFGIGGYSILEFMDSQADAEMVASEIAAPPAAPDFPANSGTVPTSSATYTVGNEGYVATGPDRSATPGTPLGFPPPTAPLQSSPPSTNAPSSSAWQENTARRNDASKFEQDMETSFELSRTYSDGFMDV